MLMQSSGLIGAVCIFQFSYTFPPLLLLMYKLQVHGASADVPYTGFGSTPRAMDSYKSMARWVRACVGTYKPEEDGPTELPRSLQIQGHNKMIQILFKIFLAGLVLACLGRFSASAVDRMLMSMQLAALWACMARGSRSRKRLPSDKRRPSDVVRTPKAVAGESEGVRTLRDVAGESEGTDATIK